MKNVLLSMFACFVCMGAVEDLEVKPFSRFNSTITAFNRLGEATVSTRYLLADKKLPNGKTHTYGMLVIADNSTGRFQWILAEPPLDVPEGLIHHAFEIGAMVAHTSPAGVVVFSLNAGRLDILDATADARDIDEAETKALRAAAQAPAGELGGMSPRWRTVVLGGLERDFWSQPFHANFGPLKILMVSRQDDTISIVIEGQWKERITLDSNYQLLRMEKVN